MTQNPIEEQVKKALAQVTRGIQQSKFREAEQLCRQILQRVPDQPQATHLLGFIANRTGHAVKALELFEKAISLDPEVPEFHNNRGLALLNLGRLEEAMTAFDDALKLNPEYVLGIANKGNAAMAMGNLEEAEKLFLASIEKSPDFAELHYNLGNVLHKLWRLDDSIKCYEKAVELKDGLAEPHNNLANALKDQGRIDESIAHYKRAVEIDPRHAKAHSNLIFSIHYKAKTTPQEVVDCVAHWRRDAERTIKKENPPYGNDPNPDRRIRVAYLTPNLRRHPHGFFIEPVLRHHDRDQFEVICYYDNKKEDEVTDRIRGYGVDWRVTAEKSDVSVAQQVFDDQVDILFDLSRHTANNRLPVFARKPAPVQVTWMGGPVASSGLPAMDYLITDRYHSPPGSAKWYVEEIYRMPRGYIVYEPPHEDVRLPDPWLPPVVDKGYITFGSYNTLAKVSPDTIEMWSQILARVPNSRLRIRTRAIGDPSTAELYRQRFASQGVDPHRIETAGWIPQKELLEDYNSIDIALDTFPYGGGVTTLEALWMGVPVITLRSDYPAANHSLSHLSYAGLSEYITAAPQRYVDLAVELANDVERLKSLRLTLRDTLVNSPVCDGPGYTEQLEFALRGMWRNWCLHGRHTKPTSGPATPPAPAPAR